ncbi:MAG: HAMP domain-containing sensor histidine kinase [Solirubrobacteraceae bacterium]|nr:HAMP domain-containing sensor histidine kinase [Patulibacter sp.]
MTRHADEPTAVGPEEGRTRLVGELMSEVYATPIAERRRFRPWRIVTRSKLIRWFKGSLAGRISAVFLLAAFVTVLGLLYATPRLQSALVAPRERSVDATLSVAAPIAQYLPTFRSSFGLPLTPSQYPDGLMTVLSRTQIGLGGSTQHVDLFEITGTGTATTLKNLSGSGAPSEFSRVVAEKNHAKRSGVIKVGDDVRVEAVQSIQLTNGSAVVGRLVVSVWQPIEDIESTVRIARQRILVAGIGGASIALLLGVWVTTRLTRRIRTLEAGARKVARGDFTARFPGEGSLELSSLARALDEMQSQLAELETARRRFIATASHELRTPLSTLQGFLELLEDEHLPAERRHEFVMHASQQAQRLGKLASDLLDLSRLDVGSVTVRRAPTDVGLLLEGLQTEFRVASAQDGTIISRVVDPRAETALIDGDRVLQLLRALVDNALGHTPPGTPITLGARRNGQRVEFTVSDAGPGIPERHQREMFEAFVTSDETRGSGLGLAISRELARRMQGDLTVTSQPGSTIFTLSLPA